MHARAILVRSLFAVSWIYSRFVRAITRFQRKFSVNHAKSAYFQRKSRKVSVNNHLPYIMMPAQLWKSHSGRVRRARELTERYDDLLLLTAAEIPDHLP